MLERLAADATRAILFAQKAASRLGHNYIDTEILLLRLIAGGSGGAAEALASLGLPLNAVRKALEAIVGQGSDFVSRDPPFTGAVQRVFERASGEARGGLVHTEHILCSLLSEIDSDSVRVLRSMSAEPDLLAEGLKKLPALQPKPALSTWEEEEDRLSSREQALSNIFGLDSFLLANSVPGTMLGWFDEKDDVLGVYINAENDYVVVGERGICRYDGEEKTYIEYKYIDSIEEAKDVEDPYLKLVLRPKGKVVMLPVLHSTEGVPDYIHVREYLSFWAMPAIPKVVKMDIQDVQSKEDFILFLRQPNVKTAGFVELADWLERGGPKPSWLGPFNIAPDLLKDPGVWRFVALLLVRVPEAAERE